MGHSSLEKYLSRNDVPLGMRIDTLIQFSNLPDFKFVRLGESLLESASETEKACYMKKADLLNRLVEFRRSRIQSDN